MDSSKEIQWHVLYTVHGNAMAAQRLFSGLSIETFIPMEKRSVTVKGKKVITKLVPILSNLIFVKNSLVRIREIKSTCTYLYYLNHNVNGTKQPMIVPMVEMEHFINFLDGNFEHVDYIDTKGFDIKKGEQVKIISGVFKGKEGTLVKITGKYNKQIVVAVDGLLAVAIKDPKPWTIVEKI